MDSPELWGGYECTVNRVGDTWFDQTPRTGHEDRIEDLALFADLGIRSLRYPVLWERVSPQDPEVRDFRWSDARMDEIRRLDMNPIVTLCHHGSGPHYTSLIDDGFAPGLAAHAAATAARYPWVRDWTPVNEILTTARFSALYGYWYPHTKDEGLFWTALLNEVDATRLAMRAIRKVNPDARLIQTDDLGYCHATPPLQAEADYQNERRWMGWDLLCGMVVPGHKLYGRVARFGLEERLRTIAEDPCPPDIIGINHYLSSERLLDHRVERHGDRSLADRDVGERAGVKIVDVDAIRNRREGVLGLPALLEQAWRRYGRPLAVTECHNGATRDEQMRWFLEVWNGVDALRRTGIDIRAVTAWSLLGSHDWNRMVTRLRGHYETGVYDCRTGTPRPTRMAALLRDLAFGMRPHAPGLKEAGWWHRPSRVLGSGPGTDASFEVKPGPRRIDTPEVLLIVSDDGPLSHLAVRACEVRGLHYVRCGDEAPGLVRSLTPWAVFDARDPDGVRARGGASDALAAECSRLDVPCALFATSSAPVPGGVLAVQTGEIYTPWDGAARAVVMLDALDDGATVQAEATAAWDLVYGPDVVDCILDLLIDQVSGPVTLLPGERMSEAAFARALAEVADRDDRLVIEIGAGAVPLPVAMLPTVSLLPPTETTLERFVRESRAARRQGDLAVRRRGDEVRMQAAE